MRPNLSFKEYLEYEEEKPGIMSTLRDLTGGRSDDDDVAAAMLPVSAQTGKTADDIISLSGYTIVRVVTNDSGKVQGYMIKPMNDPAHMERSRFKFSRGGRPVKMGKDSTEVDDEPFFMSVKDAESKLFQKDLKTAFGAMGGGMGGGMGGLPGGL